MFSRTRLSSRNGFRYDYGLDRCVLLHHSRFSFLDSFGKLNHLRSWLSKGMFPTVFLPKQNEYCKLIIRTTEKCKCYFTISAEVLLVSITFLNELRRLPNFAITLAFLRRGAIMYITIGLCNPYRILRRYFCARK